MSDEASPAQPDWLALKRKIRVRDAASLNDISEETFRRRYPHLIKKISTRRDAVELGDALAVGTPKSAAPQNAKRRPASG